MSVTAFSILAAGTDGAWLLCVSPRCWWMIPFGAKGYHNSPRTETSFTGGTKNKSTKLDASVTTHLYSMLHQQQLQEYL